VPTSPPGRCHPRAATSPAVGGSTSPAAPTRMRFLFSLFGRGGVAATPTTHAYPTLSAAFPSTISLFATPLPAVATEGIATAAKGVGPSLTSPSSALAGPSPPSTAAGTVDGMAAAAIDIASPTEPPVPLAAAAPRPRIVTVSRGCVIGLHLVADVAMEPLPAGAIPKPAHMQAKIDAALKKYSGGASGVTGRPVTLSVSRAVVSVNPTAAHSVTAVAAASSAATPATVPSRPAETAEHTAGPLAGCLPPGPLMFDRHTILFCAHGDKHPHCFGVVRKSAGTSKEGLRFRCTVFRAATHSKARNAVLALARACGAATVDGFATPCEKRRLSNVTAPPWMSSTDHTDAIGVTDSPDVPDTTVFVADARYCGHVEVMLAEVPALSDVLPGCIWAVADRRRAATTLVLGPPPRCILGPRDTLQLVDNAATGGGMGCVAKEIKLVEVLCCCPAGADATSAVLFVCRGEDLAEQVLLAYVLQLRDAATCAAVCARVCQRAVRAVVAACTLASEAYPAIARILRSTEGLARGMALGSLRRGLAQESSAVARSVDAFLQLVCVGQRLRPTRA